MAHADSLETGKKFKKTEIGEIPVDWKIVKLGDVAQINMGQSPPSVDCFDYKNGLPFFQGTAEFSTKYPTVNKWCNSPRKVAGKGDILVSVRAPVGDVNVAPEECCIGRGLAAIRGTKSDNSFLYFIMNFVRKSLIQIGQGSTFEAINKNVLFELTIPFPSCPEQKKISEILTTVDQAIEKSDQVIEKIKELKKGLMQQLLTRGIGHKEFKKTKIGEIPVDWETTELQNVLKKFINGYAFSSDDWVREGVGVIRMSNISVEGEFNVTQNNLNYVSEVTKRLVGDNIVLKKNDVIIAMTDMSQELKIVGRTAIVDSDGYLLNQRVGNLVFNSRLIDLNFLHYLTNSSSFLKQIKRTISGSAQFNSSTKEIKKTIIPRPPMHEQKKIAEILSTVDEEIRREVDNKKKLEIIKKGLTQVLLTGKARVKV